MSKLVKKLSQIPDDLLCPITNQIMKDPVMAMDGHTYEKQAIEKWFKKNKTSPMTNQQITDTKLIPNFTVKKTIQSFQERAQQFKQYNQMNINKKETYYPPQKGILLLATGAYEGQIIDGKAEGIGKLRYKDGQVYQGTFYQNSPNGYGTIKTNNGMYQGQFRNGMMEGKGVYFFKNGCKHQGQFKGGVANGYGIFRTERGDRYQGQWYNNYKHGKGKQFLVNGQCYEGSFVSGKRQSAKGKCKYANGVVYQGGWSAGRQNGWGVCKYPDGMVFQGHYENGVINGFGKCKYPDGVIHQGNYVNGKAHGPGKRIYKNGTVQQGQFQNGQYIEKGFFW